MAYFKPKQLKSNGKYYPYAVITDRPMETDELVEQIMEMSTVHKADVLAVLSVLPSVMARGMNAGRSVHLQDIGFFRYTIAARKGGQDTLDKVTADDIELTRIRFTPETHYTQGRAVTRNLAPASVRWTRWNGEEKSATGGTGSGGSEEEGGSPLG